MPTRRRSRRWPWEALTRLPPTAGSRAVAVGTGSMFLSGGLAALVSLLLPGAPATGVRTLAVLGSAAVALGVLYLVAGQRLPRWVFHSSMVTAVAMVSCGTSVSGGGVSSMAYTALYSLVLANVFGLTSWVGACLHLVVALSGALLALQAVPSPRTSPIVVVLAVQVFVCVYLGRLVRAAGSAEVDALTRLPNRRGLERRLDDELARCGRTATPLGLAVLDLDHFKAVNDELGHAAGDRLLGHFAASATSCLPPGTALARFGGDEFVLVVPGAACRETADLVREVRARLPEGVSVTVGVASWAPGESASMLVSGADAALYAAKRDRRGTTRIARDLGAALDETSPGAPARVSVAQPSGG